jgi:hypothetical protein
MKRPIRLSRLVSFGLLLSFLTAIPPISAAGSTATAKPPIAKIKLNGKEPLPPGTSATLNYGGGGGGEQNANDSAKLFWYMIPPILFYPREYQPLVACGYGSETAPNAVLTTPSGQTRTLNVEDTSSEPRCFWYSVGWQYGMELGQYQIKLTHQNGTLTYRWQIQYSKARVSAYLNETQELLMGFKPGETLTLNFYDRQDENSFIAARQVKVGPDGAVILEITVSPSANIGIPVLSIAGYGLADFDNTRRWQEGDRLFLDRNKDPDRAVRDFWAVRCQNSPPSRVDIYNFRNMRVIGNQSRSSYAGPGSEETGKVQPGTIYRIGDIRCGPDGLTYVRLERSNSDDPRKSIVGWVVEGKGQDYFLETVRNN